MTAFDEGLLSPATVGRDDIVRDAVFLDALIASERALAAAYADIGMLSAADLAAIENVLRGRLTPGGSSIIEVDALIAAAVEGGNPVIPLVRQLKAATPEGLRVWVHRGATSQDIWDSAIMSVARVAAAQVGTSLGQVADGLNHLAVAHGGEVVVARTLTQHAVPTTFGARIDSWLLGIDRAATRLAALDFPAQLAGAGGTRASFVEITGSRKATGDLVAAFARRAGLSDTGAAWHVSRWPVTELGDALVQAIDALGKVATDVATLSRTEIGELFEGVGGGSSAMPQKQNPVESILIRSAALRAPGLGATLHLAAALAGDERPDGAWHAEWPTLRELLRLALGASAHAATLAENLHMDRAAASRNLALTGGLMVSERLAIVLVPLIGRARFDELIDAAVAGADLRDLVGAMAEASGVDLDQLLDPTAHLGTAAGGETR
ncbi:MULTISPECIES: lyase family protein [unclassified Microbacterium]|uniref:lyase family protein n=1 Tax=unclassified Microbacterium TaxID=2609290 RepID=UPI000EAA6507|nr:MULTISPECIES: lyase family protein [unclassified Microbacterium]MBT2486467.1 adenylosuccinate lyase [Microbacterium sp. ISL-108]RKN69165.1 adenylosuccinate lyase [Microbacterium sp. CGR2]